MDANKLETESATDEISFTVPKNDKTITVVIEAVFQSHPYEEPVILIQEVWSTRFKYEQSKTNPNKWWNRPEVDWDANS